MGDTPLPLCSLQENQIHQRIADLRKEGLWSLRRLPKLQEAPRPKSHWDYVLEEMQWMAADFAQERRWKVAAARKVSKARQWRFSGERLLALPYVGVSGPLPGALAFRREECRGTVQGVAVLPWCTREPRLDRGGRPVRLAAAPVWHFSSSCQTLLVVGMPAAPRPTPW